MIVLPWQLIHGRCDRLSHMAVTIRQGIDADDERLSELLGFCHYGTAPHYLRMQGRWQTLELYQLINPATDS